MSPLDLGIVESLLGICLLALIVDKSLLHLGEPVTHLTCLLILLSIRLSSGFTATIVCVDHKEAGGGRSEVWKTKFKCSLMDETLELLFQMIDPLHGVEGLEAGVLHWVLDVWQGIESQELGCLGKFGSPAVQIGFEIDLLGFEFLFSSRPKVIVVRVEDVDDKIEVKVEFKLLREEVTSQHVVRYEHLPSFKELILLAAVERR